MFARIIALPFFVLASYSSVCSAISLSFSTYDFPNSTFSIIKGINDSGEFVGEYFDSGMVSRGFYSNGSVDSSIDRPGDNWGEAWGINNLTNIAGAGEQSNTHYSGYLYDGSSFNNIDYPASDFTDVFGINDSNKIVGGFGSSGSYQAFIYDYSQDIYNFLNYSAATSGLVAFGINNNDSVVGSYQDSTGTTRGYMFDGQNYHTIDFPNATWTEAYGINDHNQIVGNYEDSTGLIRGYYYDFNSAFFMSFDAAPGSLTTTAYDISNNGIIVGGFTDGSMDVHGFTATVVPVPPAVIFFVSGLLGLTGVARRTSRKGKVSG